MMIDGDGVFSDLAKLPVPWATEIDSGVMDSDFATSFGERYVSPTITARLRNGELSEQSRAMIARILFNRYGEGWKRKYALLKMEYNPIENYSMIEKENHDNSLVSTGDSTHTLDATKNNENSLIQDRTGTDKDAVYGFNSNTSRPSTEGTSTGKNTDKQTGKDITNQDETETNNRTDTDKGNRSLTRSGNIGVTTSQQMAQSELELWQWSFVEGVYADIARVLTLPIYP